MRDLVILGAGSFGREVAQLVKEINRDKPQWNLLGYLDETPEKQGTVINGNPVLGGFEWFGKNLAPNLWAVCAVANPVNKKTLVGRLSGYGLNYANLIHPSVERNEYIEMGCGNIVCWNSFLSVNICLGNHVAINPGCGIGHDTRIGDFTTLYWDVTLSGYVTLEEGCEIGSKSVVIPGRTVGRWSILGAGAVAVRDIPEACTAVGVPAKPVKFNHGRRC